MIFNLFALISILIGSLSILCCTGTQSITSDILRKINSPVDIRVLIKKMSVSDKLMIKSSGLISIESQGIRDNLRLTDDEMLNFEITKNGLKQSNKLFTFPVTIRSHDDFLFIDGESYYGHFVCEYADGTLYIINYIDLEVYLYSVVFHEIGKHGTTDAAKAQAICARSYVYSSIIYDKKSAPFDFYADESSQVYKGFRNIPSSIISSVRDTYGTILVENDEVVYTFYSSTCGGFTQPVENLFKVQRHFNSLQGVKCEYCRYSSKYYMWVQKISKKDLESKIGKFNDLKLTQFQSELPHKDKIRIISSEKTSEISLYKEFRKIIGREMIKSPFVTDITITEDLVTFKGHGFGHCVGLCQWGAIEMSLRGFSYIEILQYYFPGSKPKKIY
ncbi:MAG: SpoIID/LytB domain-containing protein [Planctomycetes bacterium]|nr:SpoIID/LytB domain-containing protein [Planctomycetota bacterium]